jgi:hypothetical protein
MGTSCINWVQLSRFYLKTETESSLETLCGVVNEDGTMENVQKYNIFIKAENSFRFIKISLIS